MIRSLLRAIRDLFRRRRDHEPRVVRLLPRSTESTFVARQLEQVRTPLYETRFTELKSRALVPAPQPRSTCTRSCDTKYVFKFHTQVCEDAWGAGPRDGMGVFLTAYGQYLDGDRAFDEVPTPGTWCLCKNEHARVTAFNDGVARCAYCSKRVRGDWVLDMPTPGPGERRG